MKIRVVVVAAVSALAVAVLLGCSPATPEERVAKLRSKFQARVNGFYVEATPQMVEPLVEPLAEGEMPAVEEVSDEAEAGEEMEAAEGAAEETPLTQNAHLDLIVQHDNDEMLPGITVEISMVGADQAEKGSWRLWVDTSTLRKANQLQFVHTLEDVPYVEGDGFAAEVRSPIPPEEYGDYSEFSPLE